jgi:signal transduction histidine kinase
MIIAWLIGNSIRQAQARAELVRAQAVAQTAMAERLRIARDLHDIVAQHRRRRDPGRLGP